MPSSPSLADPVPFARRDLWAVLALAGILSIAAGIRVHPDVCGQCHDDALYVLNAKALAEGDGYRLTNLPGEPPQTKYPPLYPLVLAALWHAGPDFPANILLFQSFSIACGALFLALAYLYMVRFGHASRSVAFLAGLFCSVYGSFVFFSVVTMAETFFGVLMVAMLWWLEAALRRPEGSFFKDLLGGVLLALPFLCRSIGILFIPLGLLLLWQRGQRWRGAAVGAALTALPWILWSLSAAQECKADPVQGYYTDYVGWWSSFGLPALSRIVTFNLLWMIMAIPSPLLDGLTVSLRSYGEFGLWAMIMLPAGLLAFGALCRDVWRGRMLPTILASYMLLVCVWPWMPHRFMMPLLPFLMMYLLRGLTLPSRLAGNEGKVGILSKGFLVAALGATAVDHVGMCLSRHENDTSNPEQREKLHHWSSTVGLLDWLRSHTEPDDVVASGIDPMVTLYTGRKSYYPIICPPLAMYYNFPYPEEQVDALAERAMRSYRPRFLALTANFHGEDEFRAWVERLQAKWPEMLVPVYTDSSDERFVIYEIHYSSTFLSQP